MRLQLTPSHGPDPRRAPGLLPPAVEGGRSLSLLVLYGTVPMVQGGNTYNIPTRIWLPYPYPREPPYCEVIPTATMEVNASAAYVEPSGRLRMPYLAQFNRQTDVRTAARRRRCAVA